MGSHSCFYGCTRCSIIGENDHFIDLLMSLLLIVYISPPFQGGSRSALDDSIYHIPYWAQRVSEYQIIQAHHRGRASYEFRCARNGACGVKDRSFSGRRSSRVWLTTRCLLVLGVVTRSRCCLLFVRAAEWLLESSMEPLQVLNG